MAEDNKYSDRGSNFLRVALRELVLIGMERRNYLLGDCYLYWLKWR